MPNVIEKLPTLADIVADECFTCYHGSSNIYTKYNLSKARVTGGAMYGLGQYFSPNEKIAQNYAAMGEADAPYLVKGDEMNGRTASTQKLIYEGELSRADMGKIVLCEKFTDEHYDLLIKEAQKRGNADIAKELTGIKNAGKHRFVDMYQWLRNKKNIEFMSSIGINGIYTENRKILTVYDTEQLNLKIKEAVVLDGTEVPSSLLSDKSVIKVQKKIASANEIPELCIISGKDLEKANAKSVTIKFEQASVVKAAAKSGSAAVKTAADLTAKKSSILAKAAAANAKFDKAVDKTVEKGTQALNNSTVGKAYHKAAEKVGETKAAQAVTKTVSKGAQKVASTTAGKAVTKTVAKVAGSAVGKSVLKKIPLVSLGAGIYFAYQRIKDGQWKSAGCEMASGIAGCFPGLGTAASVAIDAGLVANDIHEAVKSCESTEEKKTSPETPAPVKPKVPLKPKSANLEKNEPKPVKKTTLTAEQYRALVEKSRM